MIIFIYHKNNYQKLKCLKGNCISVYTIGHSTHLLTNLLKMLKEAGIEMLVDIRHFQVPENSSV